MSVELRALDVMNNSRLGLTQKTSGYELTTLDVTNNLVLWMTSATLSLELKALDAMIDSGL